ncbi:MAG TPA: hypothetical protein VII63_04465 [Caulobacteraceae bacterium]
MFRPSTIVLASFLCIASAARGQEAISTASGGPHGGAPGSSAPPPPPLDAADHDRLADAVREFGPCGPLRHKPDGTIAGAAHQAHGEVTAAVGTSGYREVSGIVCQPIGDSGAVTLGVDVARWRFSGWR